MSKDVAGTEMEQVLFIGGPLDGTRRAVSTDWSHFAHRIAKMPPLTMASFTEPETSVAFDEYVYRREWLTADGNHFSFFVLKDLPISEAILCLLTGYVSAESESESSIITLAYHMAEHIAISEKIPDTEWGRKGRELLKRLRKIDEARYDNFMSKGRHLDRTGPLGSKPSLTFTEAMESFIKTFKDKP